MIEIPAEVLAAKQHYEEKIGSGIFGVGITFDGEEWTVLVIRGPGLYAVDAPTEYNGIRVVTVSATELANKEI